VNKRERERNKLERITVIAVWTKHRYSFSESHEKTNTLCGQNVVLHVSETVMYCHVLTIIAGFKRFS